jgi:uncharacterized protein
MAIFALADLHLSFGTPSKTMEIFGQEWKNWTEKIEKNWRASIQDEDLVLIAGDISWALKTEEVLPDLQWIDALPGTKVLLKGNHDFWWGSLKKMHSILPPSIHIVQNNCFLWKDYAIAGARLWDCQEYQFGTFMQNPSKEKRETRKSAKEIEEEQKIFQREIERLKLSLNSIPPQAKTKIVMTHYPPIGALLNDSTASKLFDAFHIDCVVFGHLHGMEDNSLPFGKKNHTRYFLTSSDYLHFCPKKLF